MIVTFVSECRKKSIQKTQRVLDTYAYRIGRRTWQANLTELGLEAIRQRLTREATRSTAIACHRVTTRRQTELVWVVGNRSVFDSRGRVAVHRTRVHKPDKYVDGMWQHLPLMQSLVQMAALWHDFGKAAAPFQESLRQRSSVDVLRHEWLSLAIFDAFVAGRKDCEWLKELGEVDAWYGDRTREAAWIAEASRSSQAYPLKHPNEQPIGRWIKWLVVSHHLLPHRPEVPSCADRAADWASIVADISASWGYLKAGRDLRSPADHANAYSFPSGLPTRSDPWRKAVAETANRLLVEREANVASRWDRPNDIERSLMVLSRAGLMLGDHQYSSEDSDKGWRSDYPPYANTRKVSSTPTSETPPDVLRQRLDEHLVRVGERAATTVGRLPYLQCRMPVLEVSRELRRRSPDRFGWQNRAVGEIESLCQERSSNRQGRPGTLIVNTAGTGQGKTTANARMLAALNPNDLRVAFALGLRTLTLQTGDEYRERLKLKQRDMQVIVGSRAVQQLHQEYHQALDDHSILGEEDWLDVSAEEFFFGELNPYSEQERVLRRIFDKPKYRRLLLAPFLVCTIDHLVSATEGVRGGHQILPLLRLMSSDLVIDEIDDYDVSDLLPILRLVHLVGLLGRDLLISSATITPSIALAVFDSYAAGRQAFAGFHGANRQVDVVWVDEHQARAATAVDASQFERLHAQRMRRKATRLAKEPPKRRGAIVRIASADSDVRENEQEAARRRLWVNAMAKMAIEAHRKHFQVDPTTGRQFSIGLIRVANIEPCVAVANCLLEMHLPEDVEVRIIVYHSRQVLILRSEIEAYLGRLLDRREDRVLEDPVIRQRLREASSKNVVFVVVASPVCEVGRDHDYDWTVAEPSSMRSLIQVCGRVLRHRDPFSETENVFVPEFNFRAFVKHADRAAFKQPGFENLRVGPVPGRMLATKRLTELIDVEQFGGSVDARPRMVLPVPLRPEHRLIDLEHAVLADVLNNLSKAEHSPQGWNRGCHYLTDAAQQVTRFRASAPDTRLYLRCVDGKLCFYEPGPRDSDGVPTLLCIGEIEEERCERLWLPPQDYESLIQAKAEQFELDPLLAMKRFGELIVPQDFANNLRAEPTWISYLGAYRRRFAGAI